MRVLTATIAVFPSVLLAFPSIVVAQESRVYVGGTFNFVTQTHSDREPIGGTTQGGSALIGVQVSLYSGTVPARECRFDVEGPNNLS
jgi:hypothetical protein